MCESNLTICISHAHMTLLNCIITKSTILELSNS